MQHQYAQGDLLLLVVAICFILLGYFLPSLIAFSRRHHYRWIILAINLVLGATGIGYLLAFIWAIWPSKTGFADVLVNDPTTNSPEANRQIYSRLGRNLHTLESARVNNSFFVHSQGQQLGPYTDTEVREFLRSGTFSPSDLAWYEGAANWMPISMIPTIMAGLVPPPIKKQT